MSAGVRHIQCILNDPLHSSHIMHPLQHRLHRTAVILTALFLSLSFLLMGCRRLIAAMQIAPTPAPTLPPPAIPTANPISTAPPIITTSQPGLNGFPTLEDFWSGQAKFELDVPDTGLPMGESDTLLMSNGELWSYVHASQRSAGVKDSCNAPVEFPGCVIIYKSQDGGAHFSLAAHPICQIPCSQCPCNNETDHTAQQQYPRIAQAGNNLLLMAYEYAGGVFVRRSHDGLNWSAPTRLALSGIWNLWFRECSSTEHIGPHPFAKADYECLAGGPPGIFVEGEGADARVFVFVALGQNPAHMGCVVGSINQPADTYEQCKANPLFSGAPAYGPRNTTNAAANEFFDFRTISAAKIIRLGERYYMLYEGVRGPGPSDAGDNQFGLGLARTQANALDSAWEKFGGNPILQDLPGNIGLGHADVVVMNGETYLYTSLDGMKRSRLKLAWVK